MLSIFITAQECGYDVIICCYFGNFKFHVDNLGKLLTNLDFIENFNYYESYEDCFYKKLDIDKPRNLAKSVTVE